MNLEKLFNPQSIAIVGASPEAGKVGAVIAKNIMELGYAGKVYLVNPKYDEIFAAKCYKKLAEVESEIDLVIMAIPAKFVAGEIRENVNKAKNFVIISAGFAEMNEEGKAREAELLQLAKDNDLNILGPNCLGFIIPKLKLNASFASGLPEVGNIAFVTQSGALAVALTDLAKAEKIYFSKIVSIGNKMNITETEMLTYLEKDADTAVIGMYLEGIKSGREFLEIASRVSRTKPIVVLKAGKTERSQKAIASHTGALAGSDEIMDVAFAKAGILRARDLEEFFNLIGFISHNKSMVSNKIAVITNAGGVGVLATDAFLRKEIVLAELGEKTKAALRKILPEESSVENPVDLLGDALKDRYKKVLQIIEKDQEIGAVICLLTPQDQTPVEKIARVIAKFNAKSQKAIVASFVGGKKVEKGVKKLRAENIFNFAFPESAVSVLDAYYRWNFKEKNPIDNLCGSINEERKIKASAIIDAAKKENRHALYFSESRKVMEMYGINTSKSFEINLAGSKSPLGGLLEPRIDIDFPVVLKVDSDEILHKTDRGGLILNIKNQAELEAAVQKMRENFPGAKLITQPMLAAGMEIILGIKRDANFGPVVVYGLGGIYTEVFKLAEMLIPPFSKEAVENSLRTGKLGFLFRETRGQKIYNLPELAQIICALGDFSQELDGASEFDINPLLVYNNGNKAVAVDVKVII
ncbi:MAG: acetate--CoA ligase family protein [Candidatus Moranbacteria bacterium]|nr:acetate--CoA ligase family protein [Candidatus Moranbacteria bacterium]